METVAGTIPVLAPNQPQGNANGLLVRHLLLGELPEALKPTPEHHQLVLALVWGDDHLLDLKEVQPGRKVTIGSHDGVDLQVFHEVTRLGSVPIVDTVDGRIRVFFPAGATARIDLGKRELTTVDLLEGDLGKAVTTPVSGVWMELELHERATIHFGHVRLIARYLRPVAARKPSPYGKWFWARVATYLLTGLATWRMLRPDEP